MIIFILFAVLIIGLGTTLLSLPFYKKLNLFQVEPSHQSQASLHILRENLDQLKSDHSQGLLSDTEFEEQRVELEKRALDEVVKDSNTTHNASQGASSRTLGISKLPIYLAITVPLTALALYFLLGNPAAINPPSDPKEEQILAMVKQLEERLKADPKNAQGWVFLARTYGALNRLKDAKGAFEQAMALDPNNSNVLSDYADLIAFENKGINDQAQSFIARALKIDPNNPKALALNGTAAFEKKDYASAIKNWEKAIPNLGPKDGEFAQGLRASITEAQSLINPQAKVAKNPAQEISGKAMLSPKVASEVSAGDTVFIYARAIQGPRMPIAIIKSSVDQLPLSFTLSDAQAMAPELKLSNFKEVTLTARISKSGNAIAQKGDLIGVIQKVNVGEKNVQLIIQDIQP